MLKNKLIEKILTLSSKKKEGHIGSSLSILDILIALYSNHIQKTNNRFILSKGHASLGLYVVLDYFGITSSNIESFCDFNSELGGHPSNKVNGVETSTGSLGHGLPIAVGMAIGYKIQKIDGKIFVLIGDGESNEGTIWESALLAAHHKLNNLVCIMDHNKSGDRALKIDSVIKKFEAFNWSVLEIDGHDPVQIDNALNAISDKPLFVLANTIKGKGVAIMENNPEWHHKSPSSDELQKFLKELQ